MDDQQTNPTTPPLETPPTSEQPKKAVQKIGKIVVDRELCIGAASCLALAANTFELDEENKAIVKNPKGDSDEDIHAAAVSCPTNAIFLYDEKGNQIYPAPQ
ncbi:MAG: ferredoxin [Candidatus Kerfeldbacteria bacterium]|nr:ferredoxin [Candidatus Kerfeldbacteria bacterium]